MTDRHWSDEALRDFHSARALEIQNRLDAAVKQAVLAVFEDDEIGAKYMTPTARGWRLGFKEGIGFDVDVSEAYRPGRET